MAAKVQSRKVIMRGSPLQAFSGYLSSQSAAQDKAYQPQQPSITISRETGSGAVTIAQKLVERLNAVSKPSGDTASWMVFDRNLAKQVLTDHALSQNLEKFMVEDARLPVEAIVEELLGLHPTQWTLVQHTTKTILRLAGLGRTILVGRGAEAITNRLPFVFHVRLVAPRRSGPHLGRRDLDIQYQPPRCRSGLPPSRRNRQHAGTLQEGNWRALSGARRLL